MNDFYDWDKHWSDFDESTQFNPAQQYRFKLISDALHRFPASRLVDIGCGQGDLLRYVSREFPMMELYGFELSESGVESTRAKVPGAAVEVLDLLSEGASDRLVHVKADIATCSEVLEHVPDPRRFLERAKLALRPGGTLIVTVPGGPRTAFDKAIGHIRHFDRASAGELLKDAGFDAVQVFGAGFPFFDLYKLAALARGEKVASDYQGDPSKVFSGAMRFFRTAFRFNLNNSPFGWQIVVTGERPKDEPGLDRRWEVN